MKEMKKPLPRGTETEELDPGHRFKFSGTPPKEVIESVLAAAMAEIFQTCEVTAFSISEKLSNEESFASAIAITRTIMNEVNFHFSTCQLKTLTPRHQNFKKLMPLWQQRAEFFAEVIKDKDENHPDVRAAAKELVGIITWYHILFDSKTPQKMATEMTEAYISEFHQEPN